MTEKEKSYAGILYQSGNPELIADCDITVKSCTSKTNCILWTVRCVRWRFATCWEKWEKIARWNKPYFVRTGILRHWEIMFF